VVTLACLAVWALARWFFFVGYEGSDDLFYTRFAALWNRTPINHWEARLLGNALIGVCLGIFGVHEWAGTLPALGASSIILVTAILTCRLFGTLRQAWWAGLLVAVMPLEVGNATTVSAHAVMVGLMAAGTLAFLLAGDSPKARWTAAACLPLGVIAHYNGSYYVASLLLAGLLIDWRKYARPVGWVVAGGIVALALEMLTFRLLFGEATLGLRLSSPSTLQAHGASTVRSLSGSMIVWSLQQGFAGKPFGVALAAAAVGTVCCYRRMPQPLRILAVAALCFWLVINFGSYVPWEYRPFWRNTRYMHPLVMPVAVLLAVVLAETKGRYLASLCGLATVTACVFLLALAGSWGQNVRISRELLEYVRLHPDQRFFTDIHTANEMYVLNRLETLPNLIAGAEYGRSNYLDKRIQLVHGRPGARCDAVLINPLNSQRTPDFEALVTSCLGPIQYETRSGYRTICEWIPPFRVKDWAVRKPPARVHCLRHPATYPAVAMRNQEN
jgi:hypothetical protein